MYFVDDEKIAQNLQRNLNTSGAFKKDGKENLKLTDSKLEYHDPTPNIHELFVLFDKKFFWSKLGRVDIEWSNRMTTCAGLCRYQGKRGLCSIKLSAPLLSLRPRKDLVETLLHEMIHAYLFVTENYRDREDHGPEFHRHMYRINEQAGTNITVYHSFHDEVAYYQKHIWRCDGPCQNRRPYFGFVKRAMNRAPGPYDRWWQEHQSSCGGTFKKVSEPPKTDKKRPGNNKDNRTKTIAGIKDIRDFFSNEHSPKISLSVKNNENFSNIHTIKDLNKGTCCNTDQHNKWNLIQKQKKMEKISESSMVKGTFNDENDKNEHLSVRATVRNIWANKYPLPNEFGKRPSNSNSQLPEDMTVGVKRKQVTCPVCNMPFSEILINEHIDECLSKECTREILNETLTVERGTETNNLGELKNSFTTEENRNLKLAQCPVCGEALQQKDLNEHLEICLNITFQNEDVSKEDEADGNNVPCPCCLKWIPENTINDHIDECLTFVALKTQSAGLD